MKKENQNMVELTDEELLDLAGGYSGTISIVINPPIRLFYGIKPPITIDPIIRPLYGIDPTFPQPLYGIKPENLD